MIKLEGCGTALATPFKDGKVDYEAYEGLVRRQVDSGIDFLVPLGSTAETPCLEDGEKCRLLEIARSVSGSLPLVVGAGSNSPAATVRNMRLLSQFGPDAYLVVVPFYNKPTQEGIFEYFKYVSEAADKPVVAYNVPGRTGVNMTAATTLRVAGLPGVIAVKEASGDLGQIRSIIEAAPEGFRVFSGNDDQTADVVLSGGAGVISVASNVDPSRMVRFTHALLRGEEGEYGRLSGELAPLFDACFVESNPIPVKAALRILGLCSSEMRLPLTEATEETFGIMENVLGGLGL